MPSNAIFSNLGRIKRILVFSIKQYKFDVGPHASHALLKILDDLHDINKLIQDQKFKLVVSFDYETKDKLPDLDLNENVLFVAAANSDCSINTKWTQDTFHIVPVADGSSLIRYNTKGTAVMSDCQRIALEDLGVFSATEPLDNIFDGGNVMRGRGMDGKDYLLVGIKKYCNYETPELERDFMVAKENIFRIDLPCFYHKKREHLLFHLDLFAAIIGKCPGGRFLGKEVLFIAKGYDTDGDANYGFNKCMRKMFKNLNKNAGDKFFAVEIPMIIIQIGDNKPFAYSFCNCIVENYLDEDQKHVLNVYFPRFKERVQNDYDNLKSNEEKELFENQLEKFVNLLIPETQKQNIFNLAALKVFDAQELNAIMPSLDRKVKTKIQVEVIGQWVKEQLEEVGEKIGANVKHIAIDYEDETRLRMGALHCRVKVIERDCVNINLPGTTT